MTKIAFVTTNNNKVETLQKKLYNSNIELVWSDIKLLEPQSDSFTTVAIAKAKQAFDLLGIPVLVHDSGLTIPELNNFPGVYTKYISDTIGNNGILKLLQDAKDRNAYLEQTFCYYDNKIIKCFSDKVPGHISNELTSCPSNNKKWGKIWDIFIPLGFEQPRSQIPDNEYFKKRPRIQIGNAWDDLLNFLTFIKD